mmetsp:Transcript_48845/g.136767  ORF Transcript_48845/g.136767 Transcript_48845/m.136767 type:complete len:435 (-) Transcript_48845:282-1586(-)
MHGYPTPIARMTRQPQRQKRQRRQRRRRCDASPVPSTTNRGGLALPRHSASTTLVNVHVLGAVSPLGLRVLGGLPLATLRLRWLLWLRLVLRRRWLRLLENIVRHFRELLVFLFHVRAQKDWPLRLRHRRLLGLHGIQPLLELAASLHDSRELIRRDVPVLFARTLRGSPVVRDSSLDRHDPFLSHAGLVEAPSHSIAKGFQLSELFDVLRLRGVLRVVEPVLRLREVAAEAITVGIRDERPIRAAAADLVPRGKNVTLEVVALLVGFDDFAHFCLHGRLLIHALQHLRVVKTRSARRDDVEVRPLGALLHPRDLHPLVLFLRRLRLLFRGGVALVFLVRPVGFRLAVAHGGVPGRRLAFLRGLGVGIRAGLFPLGWTGLLRRQLALLLHLFLVLLLLDKLRALDGEGAMQRQLRLHFDLFHVRRSGELHLIHA